MLAESLDGWLVAAGLLFGGIAASLLALVALFPASKGKAATTLTLLAPAAIVTIGITCWLGYGYYARSPMHNHEEVIDNYVRPWFFMASLPLATSLLACSMLWFKKKTEIAERLKSVNRRSWIIGFTALILVFVIFGLLVRHTKQPDDTRLQGTWRLDQDAAFAALAERDPQWTNAPAEKVQKSKKLIEIMAFTFTYSQGVVQYHNRDVAGSYKYRVLEQGNDFVVIRGQDEKLGNSPDTRIRFIDGGSSYWLDSGMYGNGSPEKYVRVVTGQN